MPKLQGDGEGQMQLRVMGERMSTPRSASAGILLAAACLVVQGQTITTIAGTGLNGYSGDGGPGTSAMVGFIARIAVDDQGNVYLPQTLDHVVRRLDINGTITTVAGNGQAGIDGNGGPARRAALASPNGVCADHVGNYYVVNTNGGQVRRVAPDGTISLFAGGGRATVADGLPANSVQLMLPVGCAADRLGNIYINQSQHVHAVRKVDSKGIITTVAGTGTAGFSGENGPANKAALNLPEHIAVDDAGRLYIYDFGNARIRRVDLDGIIKTVLGDGRFVSSPDGPVTVNTSIAGRSLAIAPNGDLFFSESGKIRKMSRQTLTTVAGTGIEGYGGDGGPALTAKVGPAHFMAVDRKCNLYLSDFRNFRIRKITGLGGGNSPQISSASIVNAASFQPGISPGGLATIFGRNLGASPGQVLIASGSTWNSKLGDTSVKINNVAAPIYQLLNLNGTEQMTIQVPSTLPPSDVVSVTVESSLGASEPVNVRLKGASPGIFLVDGKAGAFLHGATSLVVGASAPATPGEVLIAYLSGMGLTTNQPLDGRPASLEQLSYTTNPPQLTVNGQPAEILFSGLAPGFIGLYQINFAVPAGTASGEAQIVVTLLDEKSNAAVLHVR